MAKKNFDLGKGQPSNNSFDLGKEKPTRSFDLNKEEEEAPAPKPTPQPAPKPAPAPAPTPVPVPEPEKKSHLWWWVVLVAALAGIIAWAMWPETTETAKEEMAQEVPVVVPQSVADEELPQEVEEVAPVQEAAPAPAPAPAAFDLEAEASRVIRGDYRNNPDRRNALGDRYEQIQRRVNERKAAGEF